jgi:hypothetical protein
MVAPTRIASSVFLRDSRPVVVSNGNVQSPAMRKRCWAGAARDLRADGCSDGLRPPVQGERPAHSSPSLGPLRMMPCGPSFDLLSSDLSNRCHVSSVVTAACQSSRTPSAARVCARVCARAARMCAGGGGRPRRLAGVRLRRRDARRISAAKGRRRFHRRAPRRPAEAEGRRLPMPPLPCRRSSLRCNRLRRLHRAAKAALGATVFFACLHFPQVASSGNAALGGEDFTDAIAHLCGSCHAVPCCAVPRRDGQTASNTAAGISATCVLTSVIDTMATLFAATVIFGEGRRVTRRSSVPVPSPSARPPASSLARFCNRVSRARARRTWRCGTAT